jgi:hypothetical protein
LSNPSFLALISVFKVGFLVWGFKINFQEKPWSAKGSMVFFSIMKSFDPIK